MSSIVGDFARSTCRCADSECEHRQEIIPELPTKKADRVKGQIYINKKGEKVIWNGRILHCEHGREKSRCKESHYLSIMSTREDSLDIPNDFMSFLKNGSVIKGTWKKIENHKIYADWLGKKLRYETEEDWYKITKKKICNNYGCGLLLKYYNNSPLKFIQSVFPNIDWLPWKFILTKNGYWKEKKNQKLYADWLGKKLGYKTEEDWYKITRKDFCNNYGGGLLASYYNNSPLTFVISVFPDIDWLPWKFIQTPHYYP